MKEIFTYVHMCKVSLFPKNLRLNGAPRATNILTFPKYISIQFE